MNIWFHIVAVENAMVLFCSFIPLTFVGNTNFLRMVVVIAEIYLTHILRSLSRTQYLPPVVPIFGLTLGITVKFYVMVADSVLPKWGDSVCPDVLMKNTTLLLSLKLPAT